MRRSPRFEAFDVLRLLFAAFKEATRSTYGGELVGYVIDGGAVLVSDFTELFVVSVADIDAPGVLESGGEAARSHPVDLVGGRTVLLERRQVLPNGDVEGVLSAAEGLDANVVMNRDGFAQPKSVAASTIRTRADNSDSESKTRSAQTSGVYQRAR